MTDLKTFAAKVKEMRIVQKAYFNAKKNKNWSGAADLLIQAINLEHEVDALVKEIFQTQTLPFND